MAFNIDQFWAFETRQHMDTASLTFSSLKEPFSELVNLCTGSISSGKKILLFGNGGSAADAQHIATELTIRYVRDRDPIPALALTTDTSALTAAGNDLGFDRIFSRQVEALGQVGDVAIGISTSGQSANVLSALGAARERGMITAGFTGNDGGKMPAVCDVLLVVPSKTTARIQEMHITLGQMLCAALEQRLGLV